MLHEALQRPKPKTQSFSLRSMNFPVFVLAKDCGEVLRFNSIEEMQHELEEIDIENGEYTAWDRAGTPLKPSVQKPIWLHIEAENLKVKHLQLREALMQYATASGIEVKIESDFESAFAQIKSRCNKQASKPGFVW
jgi:hypothetical protein